MIVTKGQRVLFFTDVLHVHKDRGLFTGVIHQSGLGFGTYLGHEIKVRGKLYSVPSWRFVEVSS